MGSGAKEPSYNIEQDANLAMIAQTWEVIGNSSMADQVLAQIGHPTVYANVSSNLNTLRTQKIQQQMQEQQANFEKQMTEMQNQYAERQARAETERKQQIEDYNKAQQEQQASAQQVTNAQQKADVSAYSYLRADVKRNTGNLTAGHSSGALTAKKTLQGFGGNDEDLQAKEQWY